MRLEKITSSESDTFQLGKSFSVHLRNGQTAALFGEIGSGKTVFIKGLCEGLRVIQPVTSQTFVIMSEYDGFIRDQKTTVRHFDFYRVEKENDLRELGLNEFIGEAGSVALIEWAEHVARFLPKEFWEVQFEKLSENERKITIEWHT
jgi:tRNA threonylcarbamoyladenosine biosynthesis protein TsaE